MQSYVAGVLFTFSFAWNVAQYVWRARSETKHSDTPWSSDTPNFKLINEVHTLTIKHSVFSVMAGLIVEILFMLFSIIALCNGLKMSEYGAYWLTGFPLSNSQLWVPMVIFNIKKQRNKYKEKFEILQSIGIIVIKSKETRVVTYTCRYF